MERIAVIFERIGPYHQARLAAAGRRFAQENVEVLGIDLADRDLTYAWDATGNGSGYRKRTLFPGECYQDISKQRIRSAVRSVLYEEKPDAVAIAGWVSPEARAALSWSRKNRVASILMSATTRDDARRVWWREAVKKLLVRQFDSAVVGGQPQWEYACDLGMAESNVFKGYNVVDNRYFADACQDVLAHKEQVRAKLGLPRKYLLMSSRFVEVKNIVPFLGSYAMYANQTQEPYKLVICGSGPLEGEIRRCIQILGIESLVVFPGFVQYPDLPFYYALASAFLLPSLKETWGLVVNEAMACGLPVLVSKRCGCVHDLVREESNGFVLDPFCTESMGRSLLAFHQMTDSGKKAMGQSSKAIIEQYGPERFAEAMWNAFVTARGRRGCHIKQACSGQSGISDKRTN